MTEIYRMLSFTALLSGSWHLLASRFLRHLNHRRLHWQDPQLRLYQTRRRNWNHLQVFEENVLKLKNPPDQRSNPPLKTKKPTSDQASNSDSATLYSIVSLLLEQHSKTGWRPSHVPWQFWMVSRRQSFYWSCMESPSPPFQSPSYSVSCFISCLPWFSFRFLNLSSPLKEAVCRHKPVLCLSSYHVFINKHAFWSHSLKHIPGTCSHWRIAVIQ